MSVPFIMSKHESLKRKARLLAKELDIPYQKALDALREIEGQKLPVLTSAQLFSGAIVEKKIQALFAESEGRQTLANVIQTEIIKRLEKSFTHKLLRTRVLKKKERPNPAGGVYQGSPPVQTGQTGLWNTGDFSLVERMSSFDWTITQTKEFRNNGTFQENLKEATDKMAQELLDTEEWDLLKLIQRISAGTTTPKSLRQWGGLKKDKTGFLLINPGTKIPSEGDWEVLASNQIEKNVAYHIEGVFGTRWVYDRGEYTTLHVDDAMHRRIGFISFGISGFSIDDGGPKTIKYDLSKIAASVQEAHQEILEAINNSVARKALEVISLAPGELPIESKPPGATVFLVGEERENIVAVSKPKKVIFACFELGGNYPFLQVDSPDKLARLIEMQTQRIVLEEETLLFALFNVAADHTGGEKDLELSLEDLENRSGMIFVHPDNAPDDVDDCSKVFTSDACPKDYAYLVDGIAGSLYERTPITALKSHKEVSVFEHIGMGITRPEYITRVKLQKIKFWKPQSTAFKSFYGKPLDKKEAAYLNKLALDHRANHRSGQNQERKTLIYLGGKNSGKTTLALEILKREIQIQISLEPCDAKAVATFAVFCPMPEIYRTQLKTYYMGPGGDITERGQDLFFTHKGVTVIVRFLKDPEKVRGCEFDLAVFDEVRPTTLVKANKLVIVGTFLWPPDELEKGWFDLNTFILCPHTKETRRIALKNVTGHWDGYIRTPRRAHPHLENGVVSDALGISRLMGGEVPVIDKTIGVDAWVIDKNKNVRKIPAEDKKLATPIVILDVNIGWGEKTAEAFKDAGAQSLKYVEEKLLGKLLEASATKTIEVGSLNELDGTILQNPHWDEIYTVPKKIDYDEGTHIRPGKVGHLLVRSPMEISEEERKGPGANFRYWATESFGMCILRPDLVTRVRIRAQKTLPETKNPRKAFQLDHPDEGQSKIVFCETRGGAKALFSEVECDSFTDVKVTRRTDLDKYIHGVPKKLLLKEGWWFSCDTCGEHTTKENLGAIHADLVVCFPCAYIKPRKEDEELQGLPLYTQSMRDALDYAERQGDGVSLGDFVVGGKQKHAWVEDHLALHMKKGYLIARRIRGTTYYYRAVPVEEPR